LVTRDRFLLGRVATRILALDGTGGGTVFADYEQWEATTEETDRVSRNGRVPDDATEVTTPPSVDGGAVAKRLTYLEKREWEGMEQTILDAEEQLVTCRQAVEDPSVASDPVVLAARWKALEAARAEVDRLYARWAELETKHG
jgi:ATP-binding cassette subfamily F protein uup